MKRARNVPVLMYHHVTPAGGMICTTPDLFDDQMAGLARAGYTSLTAQAFADFLAGGDAPEKSVLITFDDGYLNNWVYAHPILKRHGMNAVLFAVTGWIGEGPCRPFLGADATISTGVTVSSGATASTDVIASTHEASTQLPFCPDHAQCKRTIAAGDADSVMARWSELAAMQTAGTFEVFSHTHTHTRWDLTCAKAREKRTRIDDELVRSRKLLKERLGVEGPHLCWPQGYFDADYLAAASAAGFTHLYTTDPWGQNRPFNDPGHIYRFAVRNKGADWLLKRLWLTAHPVLGPIYHRFKAWKKRHKKA